MFSETLGNTSSIEAELVRELLDGRACEIFADQVVFVDRLSFHGMVYNLETEDGWYSAGGIITHNCRCAIGLEPRDSRMTKGGAGSGNFGHAGRPGEVGGSASEGGFNPVPGIKESWYQFDNRWNETPDGKSPYGWDYTAPANYTPPAIHHEVTRGDHGLWGSSHGASQDITAAAAQQMGIAGYRGDPNSDAGKVADKFLTAIADDKTGSEEVLYHSFENTRKTDFKVGDTMRLPLTATAGHPESYGLRLEMESQEGQPTYFVFDKGTQMAAYSKWKPSDAKDFGHVYSEALVAGGFVVTGVSTHYMGSQHRNRPIGPGETPQVYGRVVTLKQTETFNPKTKEWTRRG